MLAFFRRSQSSWFVLGLLGLILVSIIATGQFTNGAGGISGLAAGRNWIARFGGTCAGSFCLGGNTVGADDLQNRMQGQLENARRKNPAMDMIQLIQQGGFEQTLEQLLSSRTLNYFADDQGMVVSKRSVDKQINEIGAFRGIGGTFDRDTFLRVLAEKKLTEQGVRDDMASDIMLLRLVTPVGGGAKMPAQIVTPYASLLLEAREGQIAAVPSAALANAKPPTDAELATFYARNTLRYTVPETRVIRYATFDRSRFVGKVQPTEADIVAEYKRDAATYAPSEKRVFSQAIVQDQAVAQSISDKVRAGASISSAASAAGFVASKLPAQDKKAMVSFSSQAVADAAFALPKGGVTAPVKSGLGWHVVQLDSAESSTGKTLDQARSEIITKLSGKKVDDTLADFVSSIEDAAADGTSFDAITKKETLQIITLPAVTAGGVAPGQPGFKSSEDAAPILADAFKADTSDEPAVVTLPGGKGYAFYHLDKINPAAPKPLADIKQFVVQDFMADRASKAAKHMAEALVAKINGGMGLDEALKSAGVPLPPAKSISALRLQLAQAQGKVPPPLALLFSMAPGKAKLLAADDKQGWYIVKLGKITPGNAAARPDLIAATQNEMTRATGEEYVQQFVHAAQASLRFRKDEAAILRVRSALTGSTAK